MNSVTGKFLNLFTDDGYDNFGLSKRFDIFIMFPEFISDDEYSIASIEEDVENAIKKFTTSKDHTEDMDTPRNIKDVIIDAIDIDIDVVIKEVW